MVTIVFRLMIGSNVDLSCNLITKLGTIKVRHIGTCILVNSAVLRTAQGQLGFKNRSLHVPNLMHTFQTHKINYTFNTHLFFLLLS